LDVASVHDEQLPTCTPTLRRQETFGSQSSEMVLCVVFSCRKCLGRSWFYNRPVFFCSPRILPRFD